MMLGTNPKSDMWPLALLTALFVVQTPVSAQEDDENKAGAALSRDEITVTATRREESVQDVPMSITALSGLELEKRGTEEFLDFARTIPGLNVNETNRGAVDVGIRGIRTLTAGVGGATVGYYIDEISVSAPNGTPLLATFDLNRVEVLRGPQGTLFGEGSLGGTIRFISNKPDSTEFGGKFRASYGDIAHGDNDSSLAGMVNIPIARDKLALRVVGHYQNNGGFIDNVAPGFEEEDINDSEVRGARAILAFTPTERLTITPSVTFQRSAFRSSAAETLIPDALNPGQFVSVGSLQKFEPGLSAGHGVDKFIQPSVVIEYQADSFDIISSSNYFDSEFVGVEGLITRNNEIFTQEIRVVSTGDGPWQWVLGGFYKDQKSDLTIDLASPAFSLFIQTKTDLQQLAGFGTLSYTFFDRLTLDLGGRIFWESVDESAANETSIAVLPPPFPPFVISSFAEGDGENTKFIPRVNLSYDLTDNVMAYASAAKGFRRGQVNPVDSTLPFIPAGVSQVTAPDTLWSYEVGVKSSFLNGDAIFNVAAFYIDWNDIQIADAVVLPGPTVVEFIRNAGKAKSVGVEFEASLQVTDNLSVGLNGTISQAELAEDIPGLVGGGAEGDELPTSPGYQFGGNVEYTRPLFGEVTGLIRVDVTAVDGQLSALGAVDELANSDSYVLANLRAGVEWSNVQVQLFANNLFDKRAEFSFDAVNDFEIIRNRPRTVGVELLANF